MAGKKASKFVLAKRYAKALFALSHEKKQTEKVEQDLSSFVAMIESSVEVSGLLKSPVISKDNMVAALRNISEKEGFSGITTNFLLTLADNRRLALLSEVVITFRKMAEEAKGQQTAEIVSAAALSKTHIDNIAASLKKLTGKEIKVNESIDKEIIGGLVVKIGSKMLDGSIAGKLERLKVQLKKADIF